MQAAKWHIVEAKTLGGGFAGLVRLKSEMKIRARGNPHIKVEHSYLLTAELPYFYLTTQVTYPHTESKNYNQQTALKLGCQYDNNWREVMPCELQPSIFGTNQKHLRIWKHNYLGHISCYDLDYGTFSRNDNIDAFNNHITNAWIAVSDQKRGLLIAQTADAVSNFAFCPMRLRRKPEETRIFLNPFGTYYGKQWHYPTAQTGIGRALAVIMAPTLGPQAASYNGRTETFQLLIAPYIGDKPADSLCADAEAFAYPYALVSGSEAISPPPHRDWHMEI